MQATLEHMTVWGLISDASLLVKAVMLTLLLASVLSWYLIIARSRVLRQRERQANAFIQRFRSAPDLQPLYRETAQGSDPEAGIEPVFHSGLQAFSQLRQHPGNTPEVVLEGVERAMFVALSEQEIKLEKGLQFLATVGSVSPYIGLFGTVWGIMNAFLGLSQVQQASLSTVAPGIAEALIATAIGLFAAIPAVIAYNRFSARSQTLLTRYYAFGNELQVRLHRTLHGGSINLAVAA
ncbi:MULTISPECIES: protein TolQ [Pseudomonas]|jgi:biopolymer transport protein TolQ|uniref:Tol-Pal system protein TolQ n=1 Tax=Pseudomonas kielensis TaxID=2762577 RepID=A0A7X1GEB8_9PSED|nr:MULTISPECIES: protein TolQ [Pseudomonas]MBC2690901.1 protein TolQ [Pseudomonas kielensis]NBB34506.1 protein TolQ [Pseudomonas sp. BC115LW]UZM15811.1 protein TolQ [Pseudomonas kielensis]WKL51987.1 protein TolQ [Pseudomonas kielensis]